MFLNREMQGRSEQARGSQTGSEPRAWVCEAVGSGEGMLRALQPSQRIQALVRDMPSMGWRRVPAPHTFSVNFLPIHQ